MRTEKGGLAQDHDARDAHAGMGIEATIVPASNVLDGLNVVRRMLGRTWIDSNRCERGIRYGNIGASGMKTSRTGPRRPFTIFLLTELTRWRTFACGFDDTTASKTDQRGRQGERPPRGSFWSA
jgi:hypothetical protein